MGGEAETMQLVLTAKPRGGCIQRHGGRRVYEKFQACEMRLTDAKKVVGCARRTRCRWVRGRPTVMGGGDPRCAVHHALEIQNVDPPILVHVGSSLRRFREQRRADILHIDDIDVCVGVRVGDEGRAHARRDKRQDERDRNQCVRQTTFKYFFGVCPHAVSLTQDSRIVNALRENCAINATPTNQLFQGQKLISEGLLTFIRKCVKVYTGTSPGVIHIVLRFLQHFGLSLAMIIAAGAGPLILRGQHGDTNGDTEIDVLDLQHVIAEVLTDQKGNQHGDVNGDGRVDVLDFQALLNQAQQATSAPTNAPRQSDRGATVASRIVPEAEVQPFKVKPVSPAEGKSAASLGARPAPDMHMASAKTERHIQNLSPHAPPVLS